MIWIADSQTTGRRISRALQKDDDNGEEEEEEHDNEKNTRETKEGTKK